MNREIWRVVLISLFSVIFGIGLGAPFETLVAGLVAYGFWTFRVISQLFSWIDKGMRGFPPDTDGVWGEISDTLNRQRRRHRRTQERMRRTINRITRLTEALEEGILVLRSDLTIDWWNSSAAGLLALRSNDRGTPVTNLIRAPEFVSYISQKEFDGSLKLSSINPSDPVLQVSASFFGADEIVLVVTDITRVTSLEQLRKEFVGNVSHELRTPLTVMRGYLETLQDIPGNSQMAAKAFSQMSDQVMRMEVLANDLILISRLESDDHPPKVEEVNLYRLLESIVAEAELLSESQHSLSLDCEDNCTIDADAADLRSVLSNIVVNAVRHNPQGADVAIKVTRYKSYINVSVKDSGKGIDPMEIPRLTERFYRGDSSRNSDTGGTGLGLAIVKHALTRCDGRLTINSRLGQGAEFVCRFPLVSRS
ncbi:Phosphate regulon sensor protein PhoR [Gammaproteobacteria bacterium MOLA455]|nr:Phosphate regulon sensor protein PhoR [Gammaproteobacteria bacterium MOLA455]